MKSKSITYHFSLALVMCLCFQLSSAQGKQKSNLPALVESELYVSYLQDELANIKESKEKIVDKLRPGDKKAELQLKNLASEEKTLTQNLSLSNKLSKTFLSIRPPRPKPCPRPKNCHIIPNNVFQLFTTEKLKALSIQVFNNKNQLLGKNVGSLKTLSKKIPYKGLEIKLKEYSGPVTINIKKTDAKGKTIAYSVPAYFDK